MSSIEIFCSYSHRDEALRDELEKHLSLLQRQGYISTWHDRRIVAGQEWAGEIGNHLNTAQIILLFISPDFLASDYCYSTEVKRAVERHERGEACVIPIILRWVYWQDALFGKLQALPKDARPVRNWQDQDEAFLNVTEGIRKAVIELRKKFSTVPAVTVEQPDASFNKWASNAAADVPDGLNGNKVEDQPARKMLPERKTEISDSKSRILIGHSKLVRSVAISPNGRMIVSGSGDKTVKIWDLEAGRLQHTLEGHTGAVWSVAISMSGRTIASGGSDQTVRIWDLETGKPSHVLNGHDSWIRGVAISADEKTIISSGTDKTVRVWDMETGELLRTFRGYGDAVNSVVISPDGRTIVSGSHYVVKIWDLETGKLQNTLKGHDGWAMSVAISRDRKIVSGSGDKTVKVWDLQTGALLHDLTGHEDRVMCVAISKDGRTVVSGSHDETVGIWNLDAEGTKDIAQ